MVAKLTIQEKLKDLRIERKLTLEQLAGATGISRAALSGYENDEYKEISHKNILTLAKFYGVSTDYLLGMNENRKNADTEIAELHLNDDVIDLLRSGRLNNRLLCEMISHEGFQRFLTDFEIYVDGHASMAIDGMNHVVDTIRDTLEAQNSLNEQSKELLIFKNAHIHEDKYFQGIVSEDLIAIMEDIRKKHKADRQSAPLNPLMLQLTQHFHDAFDSAETVGEEKVKFLATSLGMDYDKLSDEEKQVLEEILQQSGYMNITGIPKKGRRDSQKRTP